MKSKPNSSGVFYPHGFEKWLKKNSFRLSYNCYDTDEQRRRKVFEHEDKCQHRNAYFTYLEENDYWD